MVDRPRSVNRLFARRLYDGFVEDPLRDRLIRMDAGHIVSVEPMGADALPKDALLAEIVAPGFIDLQINGAADTQFNEDPTADALDRIAAGARQGGTAHILPTFITAPGSHYTKAIAAANDALDARIPGILGVHLEGPFLSPDRPGIHPRAAIRRLEQDDVEAIAQAQGSVLVTLAPECQDHRLIGALTDAGARVFIGHSNASALDVDSAIEVGVTGVTHLFNAQAQITAREPGVVGSAFMHEALFAGIIADGVHVHPQNLALAAKLMPERLCLVTDAMKTLAGTVRHFDLCGTPITLDQGRLTGPDGTLAGAQLAMDEAVRNAIAMMGVTPAQALRMASGNPARALGLSDQLGRVAPGFRASLTLLDDALNGVGVLVDGKAFLPA